jgi:cytochrome c oxidase assembly protein subunit 15
MAEKRAIFEDVSTGQSTAPQGGMIDRGRRGARGAIRVWLMVLFALVVIMITVGGLTRLTDSGLSITEWKPVTGAWPPIGEAAWQSEFDKYQAIPEFQIQNKWMELADFKTIYWWEWSHRQLGRVIGLVWAVGFLFFWLSKKIPPRWTGRLLLVGGLGAVQGAVGWWMVSSGLVGSMTDVANYRLATHLGLAFVTLGLIAWFVFKLGREERDLMQARRLREQRLFGVATGWMHLLFLQILLGALVAGIDAGAAYTDWPLMNGQILPPDPFKFDPLWTNFFENPALVQFVHRCVGYLVGLYAIMAWLKARKSANRSTRSAFNAAALGVALQIALGIYTLMLGADWHVAILHQLVAVALWVLILRARFMAAYPVTQSIRG